MRQFAIGFFGIFIILFAAIWGWMAANPLVFIDDEYPVWAAKLKMANECKLGTLTILGDSQLAVDLVPSRIDKGAMNLSLGGSTPVENYFFARNLLHCPTLPKAVILSFAMEHFRIMETFWWRARRFGLFSVADIEEIREYSHQINSGPFSDNASGVAESMLSNLGYAIRFPPYYFSTMTSAHLFQREQHNKTLFDNAMEGRGWSSLYFTDNLWGSKGITLSAGWKYFDAIPFNDYYFNKLLSLFESHHIPVYYIATPYNQYTMDMMTPKLQSDFAAYMKGVFQKHPGVHMLGPLYPRWSWTMFNDAYHLNAKASLAFSEETREMLNENHVEGGPFVAESATGTEEKH